ncbi:MAG: thiamine phosphate synthase [Solibacillus sp.]|uniref:thiamine phosphate synthase n=1 Tax=Solibacillus sp. TaxID=1909654 RepID=UPI0033161716
MFMSFDLNKYFVMGTINCNRDPLLVLEEALQAGITVFQLREKGKNALKGDAYIQFARQCQKLCQTYKVPFLINDDVELAFTLNADGIHVGQEDTEVEKFRSFAKNKIVGVSVHTMEQLELAIANGADYAGIGPIYETTTKDDARAPVGLTLLEDAKSKFPKFPIVAIGGISTENSFILRQTGVNGVAVISAISHSNNIKETVNML